jgi:hypothetical protein
MKGKEFQIASILPAASVRSHPIINFSRIISPAEAKQAMAFFIIRHFKTPASKLRKSEIVPV